MLEKTVWDNQWWQFATEGSGTPSSDFYQLLLKFWTLTLSWPFLGSNKLNFQFWQSILTNNPHTKIPESRGTSKTSQRGSKVVDNTKTLTKSQLDLQATQRGQEYKEDRVLEIHQAMQQVLFSTARVRTLILITPSIVVGQTSKQGQMEFTRLKNVPRYTEKLKELEDFFLRTKIHIDGESFMYTRTEDQYILLDNSANYFSDRGVLFLMPEYACMFILTFIKTENFIDLPAEAGLCEQKLLAMNFFSDYKDEINGVILEEKDVEIFHTDFFPQDFAEKIKISGKSLEMIQRAPIPGNESVSEGFAEEIQHYKVATVLYVSPLNPAFEFLVRQLGQIRDFFDGIFALLVTEGISKENYKEVLSKCIGVERLNVALTNVAIGDTNARTDLYSLCLPSAYFNRHPHQQVNMSRHGIRRYEPNLISHYSDIYGLIRVFEMAYGMEFERVNFQIAEKHVEFLGVQHKALVIPQKYQYVLFLFCRQTYLLNHQREIETYMGHSCDIILCVQGNLKFHQNMFLNRFKYLKDKVTIIFDENNIFRQLDAIEKRQSDYYVYMFDQKKRYVACNFAAGQVEELQTEFEKALLQLYQFLIQQNKSRPPPSISRSEFTKLSRKETKSLFQVGLNFTPDSLSVSENAESLQDEDFD